MMTESSQSCDMLQDAGILIAEAVARSRSTAGSSLPPPHFPAKNRWSTEDAATQTQRLREVEAIAQSGSFHWDAASDTLTWSDQHYQIFGVDPATFVPTYETYLQHIFPADLERVIASIDQVLTEKHGLIDDYRIVRSDGEVRWVISRLRASVNNSGEITAVQGTCQDITDRKRAEQEIAQLNQYYSALIHTAAEGICAFRIDSTTERLHYTLWNEQMARMVGYNALDVYAHGWQLSDTREENVPRVADILDRLQHGHDLHNEYLPIIRRDGQARTLCISTSHVTDANSETTIVALVQDVTDRVRAEDAVCENESRFLQFADALPYATWMFSADGTRQFFVNPTFERLFSALPRRMLSDPYAWIESLEPTDRTRVAEALYGDLRSPLITEVRLQPELGEGRWLELRIIPILDQQQQPYMCLGLAEEITALKHAEEQRDKLRFQLAKVTRVQALRQMVAAIAHELAQPLTAIQNFAAVCLDLISADKSRQQVVNPQLRECLEKLSLQVSRAGRIVTGFRNLSQRRPPQRERVSLARLMDDTLTLVGGEMQRHGIRVQVDLPKPPPELFVDCVQLQQVLINLIRNSADAMEHTPEHARRITLAARVEGQVVKIECADSGPGLGDVDDSTLYRPFYTTKADGMGMGLPICRSILEAHGGSITVRSGQQHGAVFELTIPLT